MKAKSILIQVVENGWLVKPYYGHTFCQENDDLQMFVYRDIKDLQEQLPRLLEPESQERIGTIPGTLATGIGLGGGLGG